MELKHVNIFSYNSIYEYANYYKKSLLNHFVSNGEFKELEKIDKKIITNYLINELMEIEDIDRYYSALIDKVGKINNINKLVEVSSYYALLTRRKNTPPTIDGRYLPVINYNDISVYEDAYYIKLKYSPLGIRFAYNEKGKLIISGPRNHINAFSKIKKEEFSWNLNHLNV